MQQQYPRAELGRATVKAVVQTEQGLEVSRSMAITVLSEFDSHVTTQSNGDLFRFSFS